LWFGGFVVVGEVEMIAVFFIFLAVLIPEFPVGLALSLYE
jgi:hypothetical protein